MLPSYTFCPSFGSYLPVAVMVISWIYCCYRLEYENRKPFNFAKFSWQKLRCTNLNMMPIFFFKNFMNTHNMLLHKYVQLQNLSAFVKQCLTCSLFNVLTT